MTESEAKRILGDTTLCTPLGQAAFVGIKAINEIQQYREIGTLEEVRRMRRYAALAKKHDTIGKAIDSCAEYEEIGTVEECRAAAERQKAIKPKFEMNFGDFTSRFSCECGKKVVIRHDRGVMDNHDGPNFCSYCGRAFEWS